MKRTLAIRKSSLVTLFGGVRTSGALVKCRKVGAANWGNKSKKEEFEGNLTFSQFNEKAQSCWKSHKKVGMKMKGGKLVNDCRPKNEETEQIDEILGGVFKAVGKAAGSLPAANPTQGSRSMSGDNWNS